MLIKYLLTYFRSQWGYWIHRWGDAPLNCFRGLLLLHLHPTLKISFWASCVCPEGGSKAPGKARLLSYQLRACCFVNYIQCILFLETAWTCPPAVRQGRPGRPLQRSPQRRGGLQWDNTAHFHSVCSVLRDYYRLDASLLPVSCPETHVRFKMWNVFFSVYFSFADGFIRKPLNTAVYSK